MAYKNPLHEAPSGKKNTRNLFKKGNSPEVQKLLTKVSAKVDVGWGNQLYIRGEGAGLNWEKGVPMECVKDNEWTWSAPVADPNIQFKVLLNDQTWCQGENCKIKPGQKCELNPQF